MVREQRTELEPERRHHRPHRRYRWRHVNPDELRRWREAAGVSRERVGEILQVHPSTVSGWERNEWAPPLHTQRRLRALVGSLPVHAQAPPPRAQAPAQPTQARDEGAAPRGNQPGPGYDEVRGREEAETVTVTTAPTEITGDEELGIKRRVTTLMAQVAAGELRLPTVERDCRWGIHDGIAVVKSKRTDGMVYFFEQVTGAFYRTHAPDSTRLQGDTPRSVIEQDRAWLYPLFSSIPGGNNVIRRYHRQNVQAPAQAAPTPAREEKPMNNVATPLPAEDRLLDLNIVERRKVVMVMSTKALELGPHQVHALLRKAGAKLPDTAEIRGGPAGFSVEWSLAKDRVSGRYFDAESVGKESLSVSVPQLVGMFSLLGHNLGEKPAVTFTPQGYVRIEWTESREEVQEAA